MGSWCVLISVLCVVSGAEHAKRTAVFEYNFSESANPNTESLSSHSDFSESSPNEEVKFEQQSKDEHFSFHQPPEHHHHTLNKEVHENVKTIIVTKRIPVPYPVHVEKKVPYAVKIPVRRPYTVFVPKPYLVEIPKPVPYALKVPVPQPYTVEKRIPVPYKVAVDKPYPVHIPKPYPVFVEKKVPVHVEKQVPYEVKVPVERPYPVHIPVEKPVPYPVEKPVPYPVKVPVDRPVPVPVEKPVPVHVENPVHYAVEKPEYYTVPIKTSSHEETHHKEHESNPQNNVGSHYSYESSNSHRPYAYAYHGSPTSQVSYDFKAISQDSKQHYRGSSHDSKSHYSGSHESSSPSYSYPTKQKFISFLPGHRPQLYTEAIKSPYTSYPLRTTFSMTSDTPHNQQTTHLGTIHVSDGSYAPKWVSSNSTGWYPKQQQPQESYSYPTSQPSQSSTSTYGYYYPDPMQPDNSQISESYSQQLVKGADPNQVQLVYYAPQNTQVQASPQPTSPPPVPTEASNGGSQVYGHFSEVIHPNSNQQQEQTNYQSGKEENYASDNNQPSPTVPYTLTAPKLEAHNSAYSYQAYQLEQDNQQREWNQQQQNQHQAQEQDHQQVQQQDHQQVQQQVHQQVQQQVHQQVQQQVYQQVQQQPEYNNAQPNDPPQNFRQQPEAQPLIQHQTAPVNQQYNAQPFDSQQNYRQDQNQNNPPQNYNYNQQWDNSANQHQNYQPQEPQNIRVNDPATAADYEQKPHSFQNQVFHAYNQQDAQQNYQSEPQVAGSSPVFAQTNPYPQIVTQAPPTQKRSQKERHRTASHHDKNKGVQEVRGQNESTRTTRPSFRAKSEERTEAPPANEPEVHKTNTQIIHHGKNSRASSAAVSYSDMTRNFGKKMKRRSHKKRTSSETPQE